MTITFNSLDDIAQEFVKASEVETEALFLQGRVLVEASAQGWNVDEISAYCSSHVRRSKRTVYERYRVARTFPHPHPALRSNWELHRCAASVVDYRQTDEQAITDQQAKARDWLEIAAAEGYSTRQLRAAMKANGDDPDAGEPVFLLDNVEGMVSDVEKVDGFSLLRVVMTVKALDKLDDLLEIARKQVVFVTVVQAAALEGEAA